MASPKILYMDMKKYIKRVKFELINPWGLQQLFLLGYFKNLKTSRHGKLPPNFEHQPYSSRRYTLIGRPLDNDSMSWQRIQHFRAYSKLLKEHTDPIDIPSMTKQIRIVQIVDLLDDYFENTLGSCNVPLSYVIRGQSVVPNINHFPLVNDSLPYSPQY